jgi:putative hemolysin
MIDTLIFWNVLLVLTLIMHALFILVEMASLSMNRIRIAYLSSKDIVWAKKLSFLLARSYRLFGTVMIGTNLTLQLHSYCARSFYSSSGISPDWAPLLQICMIVIFAQLLPSIIGRKMGSLFLQKGIPLFYLSYRLFSPLIYICTLITRLKYILKRKKWKRDIPALSAEELPSLLAKEKKKKPFESLVTNFFKLHEKEIRKVALPLNCLISIEGSLTVQEACALLPPNTNFLLVKNKGSLSGIVEIRTLIQSTLTAPLNSIKKDPWILHGGMSVRSALTKFKSHREEIGIVTNMKNIPIGYLTLDDLLKEFTTQSYERTYETSCFLNTHSA